jgi:diguanylate cyclase (GGDEF)-like protein
MCHKLIAATGYSVEQLNFGALMHPGSLATINTLEIAIGAYQHGLVRDLPVEEGRLTSQKFKILDAPELLDTDLQSVPGYSGIAVLYLDIDNFKRINTELTETLVDEFILPPYQRLLAWTVEGRGYAYGEGGDEFVVLLHNTTLESASAFAVDLLKSFRVCRFPVGDTHNLVSVTISGGLAWSSLRDPELKLRANEAKKHAKGTGRNRFSVCTGDGYSNISENQPPLYPPPLPPDTEKEFNWLR